MTLSRQPIRVLSATLLASALYAAPGQAQLSGTPEAADAPEPVATPELVTKPKPFVAAKPKATYVAKPKPAPAQVAVTAPEVAPPEPVQAAAPPVAPPPAARPEPVKNAADRPWLRNKAAQQPVASAAPVTSPWRLIALCALVAGLGGAALYQRRRRTNLARAVRSDLTVMSAVRVGGKAQVVVVNVGGRKLLLGVTESEVSRLAWLDGELDAPGADAELDQDFAALDAHGALPDSELFAPGIIPEPRMVAPEPAQAEPPRRFRQLLFNALGQESQPSARTAAARAKAMGAFNAADEIAEGTRDVMTRGNAPRASASRGAASRVASPAGAPEMVDIEGQARGLILRLQKRA